LKVSCGFLDFTSNNVMESHTALLFNDGAEKEEKRIWHYKAMNLCYVNPI